MATDEDYIDDIVEYWTDFNGIEMWQRVSGAVPPTLFVRTGRQLTVDQRARIKEAAEKLLPGRRFPDWATNVARWSGETFVLQFAP